MRGIMNAGHDKESATVPRCDEDTKEVKLFSLWTPKAPLASALKVCTRPRLTAAS